MLKEEFNLDPQQTYLNCAYMGPQLKAVTEAGIRAVSAKEKPWKITADHFFEDTEELRRLAAELMGASRENIALIPSASYGLATAASMIQLNQGDKILVLEEQFPSNVYVWQELAKKTGAEVLFVPKPKDFNWTEAILRYESDNIRVLALPPCHWTDGARIDLSRIRKRFAVEKTHLVVDASQYLGADTFRVADSDPDVVVSVGYKWLLGPYSLGLMYVADRMCHHLPIEHNWINRAGAENFAGLVDYEEHFAPGARRFDVGEKSNFILVPMLKLALEWLLKVDCVKIAEHNHQLLSVLEDELIGTNYKLVDSSYRSRHMVGLYGPKDQVEGIHKKLVQRNISVSRRGDCLRISPNIYNDVDDIHKFAKVLRK